MKWAEGTFHELKGQVKEVSGRIIDNPNLEAKGIAEKIADNWQEKVFWQVKEVQGKNRERRIMHQGKQRMGEIIDKTKGKIKQAVGGLTALTVADAKLNDVELKIVPIKTIILAIIKRYHWTLTNFSKLM